MRILHVVRSDGFAGVERHVATLAAAQARAGHEVRVVGGDQAQMRGALGAAGVRTMPGSTLRQAVVEVRRSRDQHVVHAHMTAGELAAVVAGAAPLVVTRHFARPRGTTPAGRGAAALIRRRVRAQIAVSRYVARAVDGQSTVVYPGVVPVEAPPVPRRPVVLVVQRLQPEKNTDVALRAFAAGAPEDWTLEVVGRGPQRESLEQLAAGLGVADRVSFLGFRSDVADLMRSSSALLAPCEVEGLGLSVLEAMAHGLAVVASRAGAHPETVGVAAGARMFEPGEWQQAGSLLAGLAGDAAGREAYAAELVRVQRARFTPETQSEATQAVYEGVLG